jgi:hypothetical protein
LRPRTQPQAAQVPPFHRGTGSNRSVRPYCTVSVRATGSL